MTVSRLHSSPSTISHCVSHNVFGCSSYSTSLKSSILQTISGNFLQTFFSSL